VVVATELPDESGWLTCAKMMLENGAQKVVLVRHPAARAAAA